jgi:hypothetical protein
MCSVLFTTCIGAAEIKQLQHGRYVWDRGFMFRQTMHTSQEDMQHANKHPHPLVLRCTVRGADEGTVPVVLTKIVLQC